MSYKNDVIRIELRTGEKEFQTPCPNCGKDVLNNSGVKVAYWMPIHDMQFSEILNEAVAIIKLIFRGYFKQKYKKYKQHKFSNYAKKNNQTTSGKR